MIGNYKYWMTARVGNDGAGRLQGIAIVTAHASAQYTEEGREASVTIPVAPEDAAKVIADLQALLEAKLAELQLKATTGAAEALVVAAKRGELDPQRKATADAAETLTMATKSGKRDGGGK